MLAHGMERLFPDLNQMIFRQIHVGHAAVTLFFFCSGFVIPISLEQHSVGTFWVRRIFRLYPLYWASIALSVLMRFGFGLPVIEQHVLAQQFPLTLLANLTLFQEFLGFPNLHGPFWTLAVEMQFYLILTVLFVCRLHKHSLLIAAAFLLLGMLLQVAVMEFTARTLSHNGLFYLGLMFVGTCFYRHYTGTILTRQLAGIISFAIAMIAVVAFRYEAIPYLVAVLVALAVFGVFYRCHTCRFPHWLLFGGTISYSIYLMHPLAILPFPFATPPAITLLVWCGATVIVSCITYYLIEKPAIEFGRRRVKTMNPAHVVAAQQS